MFINAVGKACPIPVVMAKKELDGGCTDLVVAVDNAIAVQNLTRLASGRGLNVSSEEQDGGFPRRSGGGGDGPSPGGLRSPGVRLYGVHRQGPPRGGGPGAGL